MGKRRGRKVGLDERKQVISLVQEAQDGGCRPERACEELGVSLRSLQRWQKVSELGDLRRGPKSRPANALSAEEKAQVLSVATSLEYRDLSPRQMVPKLADQGIYLASESSFYRILKAEEMLTHRGRCRPKSGHRLEELTAQGPNQVWSWDITYLRSSILGMFFYLYLVLDIYSRKIVGFGVYDRECSEYASELIDDACRKEGISKQQLVLHSDNGGPMKGATMLATLQKLGVIPSFSRPSVSDDNPFSEALFKTLKYVPQYPTKPFASLEEAWQWVKEFVRWYNTEHLHSGICFVTPDDRHQGFDAEILEKRKMVYEKARQENPSRWSGNIRNWNPIQVVQLNPRKKKEGEEMKKAI